MQDNEPATLKSRHTADPMETIARADRAYHDVAQMHLFEFSGGAQ